MNALLAKRLVEKGAIRADTEFTAYVSAHGLSCQSDARQLGRFHLKSASFSPGSEQVVFDGTYDGNAGRIFRFSNEQIVSIDGMPPERLASIYYLTATGGEMQVGKRRGRKPRTAIGWSS